MGFSISSSHLVFFLASMVVASTLAGVFITSTDSISSGIRSREDALSERLKSDISIINDPNNMPNDPLIVYVKNTGSTSMNKTDVEILVNGTLQQPSSIQLVDGDDNIWSPTEVIKVKIDIKLESGDHWLKVVASHQSEDTLEFTI